MVYHGSMVEWGVHLTWVYVHSAICETYWVLQCSMDLWSIEGVGVHLPWYMCILIYMKLIGCNSVGWICAQLGGPSAMGICAFCYMSKLFGVMV